MSSPSIIGHESILIGLERVIRNRTIAHAYLFSGPDGVGKRTVADRFARAILCEKSVFPSCNVCRSCRAFERSIHPDFLTPEKNPKNAFVGVEEIRDVIKRLQISTGMSNRRVLMIHEAETLSLDSMNTLLKTMEEPPAYGVVILTTSTPSAILPTIHSRCQTVKFYHLHPSEIRAILENAEGFSKDTAEKAAGLAFGSVANALRYFGAPPDDRWTEMNALARRMASYDITGIIGGFIPAKESPREARERTKILLDYFLLALRTAIQYKLSSERMPAGGVDGEIVEKYAASGVDSLIDAMEQVMETRIAIDMNANPKIAVPHILGRLLSEFAR